MRNLPALSGRGRVKQRLARDAKRLMPEEMRNQRKRPGCVPHPQPGADRQAAQRRPRRPQRDRTRSGCKPRPHSRGAGSTSSTTASCPPAITGARSSSGSTKPPSSNITNSTACSMGSPTAPRSHQPDTADPGTARRTHAVAAQRTGTTGICRHRVGIPVHRQRRVRRTATARHDPRIAKPHPAHVLADLPKQPRRCVAVLRRKRTPQSTVMTRKVRGTPAPAALPGWRK